MKIIDKTVIILLNICLLVTSIIIPALAIASDPEYYSQQFEKNEIYLHENKYGDKIMTTIYFIDGNEELCAQFTDTQLDIIAMHIIDYLFNGKDSFALVMDDVLLNEVETDGVSLFGDTAVSHMKDVKNLMLTAKIAAIICSVLLIASIVFIILRRRNIGKYALKYTAMFYSVIGGFALIFCLLTFIEGLILPYRLSPPLYANLIWRNLHYLLFPFQPEKIANSFFNDTLTFVLTVDLFVDAVVRIVVICLCSVFIWLGLSTILKALYSKSSN